MCGLAGILVPGPADPEWLARQTRAMADTLRHRGPDDEGVWVDGSHGIGLGFRRLSILDLSTLGHQPMHSPSGRYTIVFNGEVYNHGALRGELRREGFAFRGHSDTEVLLAACERWGVLPAVERFVGMFALAVYDARERVLHLVRDRLGIKPLYYAHRPGLLVFGSELRAVMAEPSIPRAIDPAGLSQFLRYLYVPAPATIFTAARKLLPGHSLAIQDVAGELPPSRPYWSLHAHATAGLEAPVTGTDAEVVDQADRLLQEAVALRMEADVPLGALLSGGIDSSTVVAMMQAASSRPIQTYSISFPGTPHDEGPAARGVAEYLGTEHHDLPVGERDALAAVPRVLEHMDEPFADPSQIPTLLVSELARRDVTVALTGDGGDELFAGYNRYRWGPALIARADRWPGAVTRGAGAALGWLSQDAWDRIAGIARPVLPRRARHRLPGEKIRKFAELLRAPDALRRYQMLYSVWPEPGALLAAPEPGAGQDRLLAELLRAVPGRPLLDRAMVADQAVYLPDDLLAKVDRMSMAVSLEARVPILDHRVVEFAWRLRPEHKIRDGQGKWILRELLARRVPRALVERPKVGFTVPMAAWLRGALRPLAEEYLAPDRIRRSGLLEPAPVARAWAAFQRGHSGHALGLWGLVVFQAWYERWVK